MKEGLRASDVWEGALHTDKGNANPGFRMSQKSQEQQNQGPYLTVHDRAKFMIYRVRDTSRLTVREVQVGLLNRLPSVWMCSLGTRHYG